MKKQYPEALTIAGTDSGGGAGMNADIKTMQALKTFSTVVVAGVTAQNTLGVQDSYPLPEKIINGQFASIADDFQIKAVKTGALFDKEHIQIVANNLKKYDFGPYVLDPVMVAKGGARLLTTDAVLTLIDELIPLADLITPNLPEAEALVGNEIKNDDDMIKAGKAIQKMGAKNVMVKGGHRNDDEASDFVLLENGKSFWLTSPRIDTIRTHGTGDTLSSAIVSSLAWGKDMETSIRDGKKYLSSIIGQPLYIGNGHGPLNHGNWGKANV